MSQVVREENSAHRPASTTAVLTSEAREASADLERRGGIRPPRSMGRTQLGGVDFLSLPWTSSGDFAETIAAQVQWWLHARHVDAKVVFSNTATGDGTTLPIASGGELRILTVAGPPPDWIECFEEVSRWVAQQNLLFEAEECTRNHSVVLASRLIRFAHRDVVEAALDSIRMLLLTGASGTGKEILAEVFHRQTGRKGAFVTVNCAMFNRELLRSELFGAEAGAFTGGTRRITGAVERANGGTLFLDEIGELPSDVQPMLLRFLDRREYETLGQYGRVRRADVCVVAATNRDLREAVREGRFRADLWYRLSAHTVEVAPLRARWDDVLAFLKSRKVDRGTSLKESLSDEALELLQAHSWDGNFRELTSFVRHLTRQAQRGYIDVLTCRRALERSSLQPASAFAFGAPSLDSTRYDGQTDWAALATRAVQAFVADNGREPRSWDDQKQWNELYLKPLLFFHLCGSVPEVADGSLATHASRAAAKVQADRGTALKHLARYFDRFSKHSAPGGR